MTVESPPTSSVAVAARPTEPTLTPFEVIERVIASGDLSTMSAPDRVAFYWRTCESLGLNPLTRPFDFIKGDGGVIIMYAKKDATDQLRKIHRVDVTDLRREMDSELGVLSVFAKGRASDGRQDESVGAVFVKGLGGQTLANAIMKAETKAKRRLTLSLVGLGFLDESEIEGIGARLDIDPTSGEIHETTKPLSLLESVRAQQEALAATPTAVAPEEIEGEAEDVPADAALAGSTESAPEPEVASQDAGTAIAPAATGLCGDPSPYGDAEGCGMPAGHLAVPRAIQTHKILDAAGKVTASWPAKKP